MATFVPTSDSWITFTAPCAVRCATRRTCSQGEEHCDTTTTIDSRRHLCKSDDPTLRHSCPSARSDPRMCPRPCTRSRNDACASSPCADCTTDIRAPGCLANGYLPATMPARVQSGQWGGRDGRVRVGSVDGSLRASRHHTRIRRITRTFVHVQYSSTRSTWSERRWEDVVVDSDSSFTRAFGGRVGRGHKKKSIHVSQTMRYVTRGLMLGLQTSNTDMGTGGS